MAKEIGLSFISSCTSQSEGILSSSSIFLQLNELTKRSPINPRSWVIKRIIATEGDVVETRPTYPERNVIVPKNHVWVEGDEAFHSRDSNSYGPVSLTIDGS